MVRDKSFIFEFHYTTWTPPEMVIAIAKDIGDNKNRMERKEGYV
jgi:hypothetical protein